MNKRSKQNMDQRQTSPATSSAEYNGHSEKDYGPLYDAKRLDKSISKNLKTFEKTGVFHLLVWVAGLLTFIGILATLYAIDQEIDAREVERENIELDRIYREWSRVLLPVGGNTAKGPAISYLLSKNQDLTGMDLSCQKFDSSGSCLNPPIIADLKFEHTSGITKLPFGIGFNLPKPITSWNLSHTELRQSNFKNVQLIKAKLNHTLFKDTSIIQSKIRSEFIETIFDGSNLTDTGIEIKGSAYFINTNLSGSVLFFKSERTALEEIKDFRFSDSYFYADNPLRCIIHTNGISIDEFSCPTQIVDKIAICDKLKSNLLLLDRNRRSVECNQPYRFDYAITSSEARERYPEIYEALDAKINEKPKKLFNPFD